MAKTQRLGREPQFGDMSFSMRGAPAALPFGPAPTVMPGMPAAQGRQEGANALAGLGIPTKAEYIKQRLLEVAGTPMVKPRETIQQWNRDYMALEAQAQQQQNFETTTTATAGHRKGQSGRAQEELDLKTDYPHQERMAEIKRGPANISDSVLQSLQEQDSGFLGDSATGPSRRQLLAGDLLDERIEAGLAAIRRPKAAAQLAAAKKRTPQDEQTAAPSPMKGRRRGQQAFKPDYTKEVATTQPAVLHVIKPDGTPGTIPADQLDAFLEAYPGAKVVQ